MKLEQRTVSAFERWRDSELFLEAVCPVRTCKTVNQISDGEIVKKCEHLSSTEHGCGGTIFVFNV
jgi:hypothetical protein